MIVLFAAAAVAAPPTTAAVATEVECMTRTGVDEPLCLGTFYAKSGRFAEAAMAFEQAAQLSRSISAAVGDPRADRALAAAGNMWIAAGQPGKAALALDKALAGSGLRAEQRGEALLDRARAAEAQNDLKTARAKITEAAGSVAEDPFYWYFSAALALRENDPATAQAAINKALTLAPSDPTILFEAGHVAHASGDEAKARDYWTRAAAGDSGDVGKAAAMAIEMLSAAPVVKTDAQPPK